MQALQRVFSPPSVAEPQLRNLQWDVHFLEIAGLGLPPAVCAFHGKCGFSRERLFPNPCV